MSTIQSNASEGAEVPNGGLTRKPKNMAFKSVIENKKSKHKELEEFFEPRKSATLAVRKPVNQIQEETLTALGS